MTDSRRCSDCGAALPADAPGGHCIRCILQFGLTTHDESAANEPNADSEDQFGVQTGEAGHVPLRPSAEPVQLEPQLLNKIGRYKLLERLGEGGCGVVYLAEQEEPARRRVALKIIKLGMDTRSVIARFEAERQALALMDHPNIAKVFDGGATETGRTYFVMELVRGVKITEYCDEKKLTTHQRLE